MYMMSIMIAISVRAIRYWHIVQQTGTDTGSIRAVEQSARNALIFHSVLRAGIM